MGYFDLDKTKPDNISFTLYELSKEIAEENGEKSNYSVDDVLKKLKNAQRTGIVNHLKEDLSFDIDDYEDEFQRLQLLKLLFRYEKNDYEKIQLTEILKKPRLENVQSEYAPNSLYGIYFQQIKSELEKVIGHDLSAKRIQILHGRDQRWKSILADIIKYSYAEEGLLKENKYFTKFDLKNIHRFVDQNIYQNLSTPKYHKPTENIFMAFYTLLITHEMVCEEADRVASYQYAELYAPMDEQYVNQFLRTEKHLLSTEEQIKIINDIIVDSSSNKLYKELIFGNKKDLDKDDISGLRLSKKYLPVLQKWITQHKNTGNGNKLYGSWLVAIIQEVIYCKKNKISVKNDAYGIEESRRTLTSVLKNPDTAQAKQIQMWMIRIENRYSSDLGSTDLLCIAREIEKVFLNIRRWMLQFHNLNDIEFVDDALVHFAERIIVPRWVCANMLNRFTDEIIEHNTGYKVELHTDFPQIYDFARELAYEKEAVFKIVNQITAKVRKFENQWFILENEKEEAERIVIEYSNGEKREFLLNYWIFRNEAIQLRRFREVQPSAISNKYAEYGLEKFIFIV